MKKHIFLIYSSIFIFTACSSTISLIPDQDTQKSGQKQASANWYLQGKATSDPAQKVEYFSKAITENPDFTSAYLERAQAYLETGNYQLAISDIDTFIKSNPNVADAYRIRGKAYEATHFLNEALEDYTKSLSISPYPQTYLDRANLYKERKRYTKAIVDYSEVLKTIQDNADIYIARGVCYQKLNQPNPAIQDYQKAIELRPDDADLYYNIGSIYWVQGRWQDVVRVWEKCLELDPNHPRVRQYLPSAKKKIQ